MSVSVRALFITVLTCSFAVIVSCSFLGAVGYVAIRYMERLQGSLILMERHNELIEEKLETLPTKQALLETRLALEEGIDKNTERIEKYAGDRFYKRWFVEASELNGWKLPKELRKELPSK